MRWLSAYLGGVIAQLRVLFFPKGAGGRCYWYFPHPFHVLIFRGMAQNVATS
ncbi:MAG: DUF2867 domain-containing protein [Parachlamydiaceae bacterium]